MLRSFFIFVFIIQLSLHHCIGTNDIQNYYKYYIGYHVGQYLNPNYFSNVCERAWNADNSHNLAYFSTTILLFAGMSADVTKRARLMAIVALMASASVEMWPE